MRTAAGALALLLAVQTSAQAADDAPKRVSLAVLDGTIRTKDGTVEVVRGCYLDSPTCISTAKELADLRVQVVALRESQGIPLEAAVVAVVLAAGAGFALAKIAR